MGSGAFGDERDAGWAVREDAEPVLGDSVLAFQSELVGSGDALAEGAFSALGVAEAPVGDGVEEEVVGHGLWEPLCQAVKLGEGDFDLYGIPCGVRRGQVGVEDADEGVAKLDEAPAGF